MNVKTRSSYNAVTEEEPTLDLTTLHALAGDDKNFVSQILKQFVVQMQDAIPQLYRCYKRQEFADMKALAKELKNNTAALGMHDLQPILKAIETFDSGSTSPLDLENRIRQVQRTLTCGVEEAHKLLE